MQMNINESLNTLNEASLLCVNYASKTDNNDLLINILARESDPSIKKTIKTIYKIIDEVYGLLEPYSETVQQYYRYLDDYQITIIESLFLDMYQKKCSSVEEYGAYLSTLSQEEVNYIIVSNLSDELVSSQNKAISNKAFIQFIRKLNSDEQSQLLIIDLAMNWQEHFDVISPILKKIEKHLHKHEQVIKEIHQYGIANVRSKENLLEQIQSRTSLKIDDSSNYEFEVSVVVFQPIKLSLSIVNDSYKGYIIFGALFNYDYLNLKKEVSRDHILEINKILADPTKLDILKYLTKGQVYGREIATEIGLTPATISHHMQALIQCSFVSIHIKMNKTYYSIEKENVLQAIDQVKQYFNEM